jgi:hypothetical protein
MAGVPVLSAAASTSCPCTSPISTAIALSRQITGGDFQAREFLGQGGEHALPERRGQFDSSLLRPDAFQRLARELDQGFHHGQLAW